MRFVKRIVNHCTGGNPKQSIQSVLDSWRKKGWSSNGYHKIIDYYGISVRLMDDETIGNGVKGKNKDAIHIAYIGGMKNGKPFDTRSDAQKETLLFENTEYKKKYPNAEICGHRDLSNDLDGDGIIEPKEFIKSCPCFNAIEEYKDI
jgi:N-acetylmuramoyl-L-alanine amidase